MNPKPFGLWNSPLTPKSQAQSLRLGDSAWDSDGQTLVWMEGRGDRGVLVCASMDGHATRDLTDELSVRARAGYGGGDFCVGGGCVYFVSGGRIYRQEIRAGRAKPITPEFGEAASPALSSDKRWILYLHSHERHDCLAVVDTEGEHWPRKTVSGQDFFMQPRLSPDGKWAAWVAWNHPAMPWDETTLYLAALLPNSSGIPIFDDARILMGIKQTAVFQPEFSPDGKCLAWLGDEDGWHNLYVYDFDSRTRRRISNEHNAQLGLPAWQQGQRTFGFSHDSKKIYCVRNERGFSSLCAYSLLDGKTETVRGLEEYTDFQQPAINPVRESIAMVASSGVQPARVIVHNLATPPQSLIMKRSSSESVSKENLCEPSPITWTSGDEEVHGLLYLPRGFNNKVRNSGIASGLPPAIVRIHGGPTGQTRAMYQAESQFFTTRGYAVLEVNYRGSTGYGRKYMEALRGNWGIFDVEDAVSGARHLAAQGLADSRKLVIAGGSAGGFTVLQTLVTHPGFFRAALCLYGVSNMFTLAADTHKFEERYLDSLLGPLPESCAIYRQRSPIFHAEKIVDPIAIFQGEIDEVVPRAQSDTIVESLRRRGIPHVYHVYPGEGHGWRKPETIEDYFTNAEKFLRQHVLYA